MHQKTFVEKLDFLFIVTVVGGKVVRFCVGGVFFVVGVNLAIGNRGEAGNSSASYSSSPLSSGDFNMGNEATTAFISGSIVVASISGSNAGVTGLLGSFTSRFLFKEENALKNINALYPKHSLHSK